MSDNFVYKLETTKTFEQVVSDLEATSTENMFRVLHTHNVQETLAEKGFEIQPLKIMEVCNSGFANKALKLDMNVTMFMPCKYVVAQQDNKITVSLMLPSVIADFINNDDLRNMANEVELTLKKIMEDSV